MKHHPAIAFVAPYRIYVPDEFFHVSFSGISARIKAIPLPPIESGAAPLVSGQNVEVLHDIFGFAGRTQFYVVLGEVVHTNEPNWKERICSRDHQFVTAALQAVNRLLAVYRDQDVNRIGVPSIHVIELVRGDISNISLVVVDDDLNQVSDFVISWPGYRTMGFGQAVACEPSVVDAIRDYLANGTEIPIERELLTSARNHLYRSQLRLVPIEANTAFESYAFSALQKACPTTTLPDTSDLCQKLHELESVFFNSAASKSIPFGPWFDAAIQGWKGLLSPELKQWRSECYELRNKVIHRGYNAVTPAEADAAIKHTQAAIDRHD